MQKKSIHQPTGAHNEFMEKNSWYSWMSISKICFWTPLQMFAGDIDVSLKVSTFAFCRGYAICEKFGNPRLRGHDIWVLMKTAGFSELAQTSWTTLCMVYLDNWYIYSIHAWILIIAETLQPISGMILHFYWLLDRVSRYLSLNQFIR